MHWKLKLSVSIVQVKIINNVQKVYVLPNFGYRSHYGLLLVLEYANSTGKFPVTTTLFQYAYEHNVETTH
jgi:hypothetical protein